MINCLAHDAYRVGWICALNLELIAAIEMLDEQHHTLPQAKGDTNIYHLGCINSHNIVIVCLPRAGNCLAAAVVAQMRITFPNLKYGLLVGIGGGVPVKTSSGMIRLGHVVVSEPRDVHSGVIQYDHGKAKDGYFKRNGSLAPPPIALQNAAREVAVRCQRTGYKPIQDGIQRIQSNRRDLCHFQFPGIEKDCLYPPEYHHQRIGASCQAAECDPLRRIAQQEDDGEGFSFAIHRGTIASGELVIRDAKKRDDLAQEHDVLCFEMEAAGALTDFPCMVVRGISDYCDSHKNDIWHGYAAAAAAAYARQLFFHLPAEAASRPEESPQPAKEGHILLPSTFTFNNNATGDQFNSQGGIQNINKGSGNQFFGPPSQESTNLDRHAQGRYESDWETGDITRFI